MDETKPSWHHGRCQGSVSWQERCQQEEEEEEEEEEEGGFDSCQW